MYQNIKTCVFRKNHKTQSREVCKNTKNTVKHIFTASDFVKWNELCFCSILLDKIRCRQLHFFATLNFDIFLHLVEKMVYFLFLGKNTEVKDLSFLHWAIFTVNLHPSASSSPFCPPSICLFVSYQLSLSFVLLFYCPSSNELHLVNCFFGHISNRHNSWQNSQHLNSPFLHKTKSFSKPEVGCRWSIVEFPEPILFLRTEEALD